MIFPHTQETYTALIEILLKEGPLTAKNLHTALFKIGVKVSTSGLYKALNILEQSEIIIKNKTLFHISTEWKKSVIKFLGGTEELNLKDGESITFNIRTATQTDKLWKHYAFLLEDEGKTKGLYMYNPHQFWILIPDREKSEKEFIAYTKENNIPVYHTIGNKTQFDKLFAQEYRSDTYQINIENLSYLSATDNITIFGDYIINTQISEDLFREIDTAYNTSTHIRELKEKITHIVQKPSRYKFKLERSHKKAHILSKRLSKQFVVTKN